MSEGMLTKCVLVSASRPHVTFHTVLPGHSSFICPSLPTCPTFSLVFPLRNKRHSIYFSSGSSVAARAQNADQKDGRGKRSEIID